MRRLAGSAVALFALAACGSAGATAAGVVRGVDLRIDTGIR